MKKKRKICIVVNSRANYARIKSVLYHAKKSKKIELQIVIGASALLDRYGDLNRILKKLYNTNFFETVSIKLSNEILIIKVMENPIVQNISYEGKTE